MLEPSDPLQFCVRLSDSSLNPCNDFKLLHGFQRNVPIGLSVVFITCNAQISETSGQFLTNFRTCKRENTRK